MALIRYLASDGKFAWKDTEKEKKTQEKEETPEQIQTPSRKGKKKEETIENSETA